MQLPPLFWIVAAMAVGAALVIDVPDADTAGAPPGNAAVAVDSTATQLNESVADNWYSGEVVLPRRPDGHFYARPTIGTSEIDVLVDTGASFVALTGDDARAIGLSWSESQVRPVARGASGVVLGVPVVLDRVELGQLTARNVHAAIVPEGLHVSLLGQSFLQQINRVEISDSEMKLAGL